MFLVLTSGKFLEALGSGIGTGSIFCLSFSLSNRVRELIQFQGELGISLALSQYQTIISLIWSEFLICVQKKKKIENFVPITQAKPPVTKTQDTTTAEWLALVQLQQQLLLQQQSYAMQQHPQMASNSLRATSILYPTTPGAISVGKFPNPQTVNRLLGQ